MGSDFPAALVLVGGQLVLGLVVLRIGWWVLGGIRRDLSPAPTPAPRPPQGPGGTRALSPRRAPVEGAFGEKPSHAELPRAA